MARPSGLPQAAEKITSYDLRWSNKNRNPILVEISSECKRRQYLMIKKLQKDARTILKKAFTRLTIVPD
jgi:hypothetical protein